MHQPIYMDFMGYSQFVMPKPQVCMQLAPQLPPAQPQPQPQPQPFEKAGKKSKAKRYTRPSICLDYLKGQCTGRRFQCKYLHPDLTEFKNQFNLEPGNECQVCEVWVLTGHCKFGAKCNKLHPPNGREESGDGKKGRRGKKLQETDLEVVNAGPEVAYAEDADFEDFVEALLSPFSGGHSSSHSHLLKGNSGHDLKEADGAESSAAVAPAPSASSAAAQEEAAGLEALLNKPKAAFDQIFFDILADLHLVSA